MKKEVDEIVATLLGFFDGMDSEADEELDVDDPSENPNGPDTMLPEEVLDAEFDEIEALRKKRREAALHYATVLLETIANGNQQVTPGLVADWVDWLHRELIDALPEETKEGFRSLGINFLSPLLTEPGFAPSFFDETYRLGIEKLIRSWGLDGMADLSDPKELPHE
jgi:hypothetical protein